MKDNSPNFPSRLTRILMERDYIMGNALEQIKERWGSSFTDAIWQDIVNKPILREAYNDPLFKRDPFRDPLEHDMDLDR